MKTQGFYDVSEMEQTGTTLALLVCVKRGTVVMKKRMTLILALGMLNFAHTAMAAGSNGELALGQIEQVSSYNPQSMACHGVDAGVKKSSSLKHDKVSGKPSAERI